MLKPLQFLQDLTTRIVSSSDPSPVVDIWDYAEPAGAESDPLKRNVLQWRRIIASVRDPLTEFPGQPVDVIGFVHRTPTDEPGQFTIARPIIRCCLADTIPSGLCVYTPDADQFASDSWLRIKGIFAVQTLRNKPTLVIAPTVLQPIREPKKRYINGVF